MSTIDKSQRQKEVTARKALKGRRKIIWKNNRIIPLVNKEVFNTLVKRYFTQRDLYLKKQFGMIEDVFYSDGLKQTWASVNLLKRACEKLGRFAASYAALMQAHVCNTVYGSETFGSEFFCQMVLGHLWSKHELASTFISRSRFRKNQSQRDN